MEKYFNKTKKRLIKLMADACQIEADALRRGMLAISTPIMGIRSEISSIQELVAKMQLLKEDEIKEEGLKN